MHVTLAAVSTDLGWMALLSNRGLLCQLTFGHATEEAAIKALDATLLAEAQQCPHKDLLAARLRAYAAGKPMDFRDVAIDPGPLTDFQQKVLHRCRQIPYGETLTYGRLAAMAGFPRAARAVGNSMAANRLPLIIPCHRLIPSSGLPGAFSAPGGPAMKQRLLSLEAGRF